MLRSAGFISLPIVGMAATESDKKTLIVLVPKLDKACLSMNDMPKCLM